MKPAFSLRANERSLWSGRPGRKRVLYHAGIFVFVGLLIDFALFTPWGEVTSIRQVRDGWWGAFPQNMIIPGIILTGFAYKIGEKLRTFYTLTDDRALIHVAFLGSSTTSVDIRSVADIAVKVRKDGSGNITFGGRVRVNGEVQEPLQFEQIDDVLVVHNLIMQVKYELKGK